MKIHIALSAAAAALTLLGGSARASCGNAEALLKQAYPTATAGSDGLDVSGGDYLRQVSADGVACKVWPADPALTLVAVPLVEAHPAQTGEARGDVEIIVADTATGRPLARRLEKDMADSDAIQFGEMSLDTARYDIRSGVRAFGLRTAQEGSSRVDPYWEHALWLYTYTEGRIDRVLDGLVVEQEHGENNGDCEGTSRTVKRSVSLGGEGAGGYRDLLVDQAETNEVSKKVGEDCKATETAGAARHFVLHFGKGRYEPPPGLGADPDNPDHDLFSLIMAPADAPAPAKPTVSSAAAVKPSFDCAKASSDTEKAICGDASLAAADVAVTQAFRNLRQRLDAKAGAQLADDQKWFLSARDDVLGFAGDNPDKALQELLLARAQFLNQVRVADGTGVVGHWGSLTGDLTVKTGSGGKLDVAIDAADPVNARWVCNAEGSGKVVDGALTIVIADDGSTLTFTRTGETLKVVAEAPPNKDDWTPDYCGHNGSVEGTYFPLPAARK